MEIKTTKGEIIIVDKDDFEKLSKYRWYINKAGYAANDSKPRKVMHRFILSNPKEHVDHINRNKLDNRKCNLRLCNQSQNTANTKLNKNSKSGYKGVSWSKKYKIWTVYLTKDYKHIYGGGFKSPIKAAKRYNELASQLFGEFANLNKI